MSLANSQSLDFSLFIFLLLSVRTTSLAGRLEYGGGGEVELGGGRGRGEQRAQVCSC